MQVKQVLGLLTAVGVAMSLGLAQAGTDDEIRQRIAPVGSVCMVGEDCASPAAAGSAVTDGARSGQHIYQTYCSTCHTPGIAGAPRTGDVDDWAYRLDQGMDAVYANARDGLGGMPPMGLCMDCTDEELNASVDYMVDQSR